VSHLQHVQTSYWSVIEPLRTCDVKEVIEQMTQIAFATHDMTDITSGVINDSGSNKQDASILSSSLSFSQCIPPFIYTMACSINLSSWEINKTTFNSLHDAWEQACTVSHAVRGNLKTPRRNPSTVHLICKQPNCPFTFYVSHDKRKAAYILRRLNLNHTCAGHRQDAGGTAHTAVFIQAKVGHCH
jgi:hypothetical protein